MKELDLLWDLLSRLRGPEGCPWDKKQTPQSILTYLLEEAYELQEAVESGDFQAIREELGDLVFLALFLTHIYQEKEAFSLKETLVLAHQKMVRRHPHVFGGNPLTKAEEVVGQWHQIKAREKKEPEGFFSTLPRALPALLKAHRVSQRAAQEGFDWPGPEAVLEKVEEELAELKEALQERDTKKQQEELGDLLFALVNLGRHLKIPAEQALEGTNRKFMARFERVLEGLKARGLSPAECSLEFLERLWQETKKEREGENS
jgi:tetrapyrrole methylase family protein/MazG family protein/ATP diphosphatase